MSIVFMCYCFSQTDRTLQESFQINQPNHETRYHGLKMNQSIKSLNDGEQQMNAPDFCL